MDNRKEGGSVDPLYDTRACQIDRARSTPLFISRTQRAPESLQPVSCTSALRARPTRRRTLAPTGERDKPIEPAAQASSQVLRTSIGSDTAASETQRAAGGLAAASAKARDWRSTRSEWSMDKTNGPDQWDRPYAKTLRASASPRFVIVRPV